MLVCNVQLDNGHIVLCIRVMLPRMSYVVIPYYFFFLRGIAPEDFDFDLINIEKFIVLLMAGGLKIVRIDREKYVQRLYCHGLNIGNEINFSAQYTLQDNCLVLRINVWSNSSKLFT